MDSFRGTSSHATMLVYVDSDEIHDYLHLCDWQAELGDRVRFHIGRPRIGAAQSYRTLLEIFPGYDIYGLMTDDSEFSTPGWDDYLVDAFTRFPGRIGVVSPDHAHGPWVNFPYVSKEWIGIVGYFVHPGVHHFCWDTVVEMLGEASKIEYATDKQFLIRHHQLPQVAPSRTEPDAMAFLSFAIAERRTITTKLKRAIVAAENKERSQ